MVSYLDSLKSEDLLKSVEEKSSSSFKFGYSNTVLPTKAITILATIGKDDVLIKTMMLFKMTWIFCWAMILWKKSNVKIDFSNA